LHHLLLENNFKKNIETSPKVFVRISWRCTTVKKPEKKFKNGKKSVKSLNRKFNYQKQTCGEHDQHAQPAQILLK